MSIFVLVSVYTGCLIPASSLNVSRPLPMCMAVGTLCLRPLSISHSVHICKFMPYPLDSPSFPTSAEIN